MLVQTSKISEDLDLSPDIYSNIDLFIYYTDYIAQDKYIKSFALFGVGGVGTNFVEVVSQVYTADSITIVPFDDDTVEFHNLNRTKIFNFKDVIENQSKVTTIVNFTQNVYRQNIEVLTDPRYSRKKITKDIDDNTQNMVSFNTVNDNTKLFRKRQQVMFDCRDVLNSDFVIPGTFVKMSYNGASKISFHFKPEKILDNVVNISNTYEVTPSFAVPPKILSIFALYISTFSIYANFKTLNAGYVELNIDDFVNENSFQIIFDEDMITMDEVIEQLWFDSDIIDDDDDIDNINQYILLGVNDSINAPGGNDDINNRY